MCIICNMLWLCWKLTCKPRNHLPLLKTKRNIQKEKQHFAWFSLIHKTKKPWISIRFVIISEFERLVSGWAKSNGFLVKTSKISLITLIANCSYSWNLYSLLQEFYTGRVRTEVSAHAESANTFFFGNDCAVLRVFRLFFNVMKFQAHWNR